MRGCLIGPVFRERRRRRKGRRCQSLSQPPPPSTPMASPSIQSSSSPSSMRAARVADLIGSVELLERHSVLLLPALVVAEQVGIPLPAVPALLGVGALAAKGHVSLWLVIGAIALVALPVDLIWYELGRRRGARVLLRLCQFSPKPDVCVQRIYDLFVRYGARAMLASKFLPGLTTIMPPLAGMAGVPRLRFAIYELAGVLLWAYFWAGTGFVFSETVAEIARRVAALERPAGLGLAAVLVGLVLLKCVRRWRLSGLSRLPDFLGGPAAQVVPLEIAEDRVDGGMRCASPSPTLFPLRTSRSRLRSSSASSRPRDSTPSSSFRPSTRDASSSTARPPTSRSNAFPNGAAARSCARCRSTPTGSSRYGPTWVRPGTT